MRIVRVRVRVPRDRVIVSGERRYRLQATSPTGMRRAQDLVLSPEAWRALQGRDDVQAMLARGELKEVRPW